MYSMISLNSVRLTIALLLLNFSGFAQERKCSDFKTGVFHYSKPEYKKYKVVRTKTIQTETDTITGMAIEGSINWTSDCHYELIYTKVSEPKYESLIGQKIIVQIVKIVGNTVLCTSEGFGLKLELEMVKSNF